MIKKGLADLKRKKCPEDFHIIHVVKLPDSKVQFKCSYAI